MVIRRQSSLDKINYEAKGQQQMFGRDNIFFKSINLPKPQNFYKLCILMNKIHLIRLNSSLMVSLRYFYIILIKNEC